MCFGTQPLNNLGQLPNYYPAPPVINALWNVPSLRPARSLLDFQLKTTWVNGYWRPTGNALHPYEWVNGYWRSQ